MNRLLISGTNSGCGKTTVTVALLAACAARGLSLASFKCGPDFIDPMFHRAVMGVSSHNLDSFFCEEMALKQVFAQNAGRDLSIIEGVMGYYDGIGRTEKASTYEIATITESPVVLVLDAKGMSNSAGAVLQGFLNYRENSAIKGVIFNGLSEKLYPMMAEIAQQAGVTPFGFLPKEAEISIESRHLGLTAAAEIDDIKQKVAALGALAEHHIDIDGLIALAAEASNLEVLPRQNPPTERRVRIAVSYDRAFCFIYRENIESLEALGCEIEYFSPLEDRELPSGIGGLYLCGGYPELSLEQLSGNTSMLHSVKAHITAGLPTIAECGGFMYLHEFLGEFPMAGVVHAKAYETDHLQRFGYVTLTANRDNLLCKKGERIRAREFHYWDSTDNGNCFTIKKAGRSLHYPAVLATDSLFAGFPHLYFPANIQFVKSFVEKAIQHAQN